jgi:teichuronic acid biosynthesis glycosyltransferase TuaC
VIGSPTFERAYPDELQSRVTALRLNDHVRLAGNMPPRDVANWLRAADVFALATAREGCCNAVLEALAVGVPVVTTPVGDNAEFVRPGVSGALVPVDDAVGLASAIVQALRNREWDRRGISIGLHRQVGSWTDVGERVVKYFESSLAG